MITFARARRGVSLAALLAVLWQPVPAALAGQLPPGAATPGQATPLPHSRPIGATPNLQAGGRPAGSEGREVTMKPGPHVSISPVLAALALAALLADPIAAQYRRQSDGRLPLPWENNRFRLTQISVEPGATLPAGGNQVLVYLTADPDGRMPSEAVWQGAGAGAVQNRGPVRLDAIAIEVKDARGAASGTPGEALDAQYGVDVSPLVDNDRVLVVKQRYGPIAYGGPLHFHGEDVLVVYLRGGYTWPLTDFWGASRVRRGEVDVIPANTPHRLGNAGGDPLELLVIVPK